MIERLNSEGQALRPQHNQFMDGQLGHRGDEALDAAVHGNTVKGDNPVPHPQPVSNRAVSNLGHAIQVVQPDVQPIVAPADAQQERSVARPLAVLEHLICADLLHLPVDLQQCLRARSASAGAQHHSVGAAVMLSTNAGSENAFASSYATAPPNCFTVNMGI